MKIITLFLILIVSLVVSSCEPTMIDVIISNKKDKKVSFFLDINKNYNLNNFDLEIPLIRNEVKNQYPDSILSCQYIKNNDANSIPCTTLPNLFVSTNGILSLSTNYIENGDYAFSLIANYGNKVEAVNFEIKVNNPDRAPIINAIGNKVVSENNLLNFSILATDPDGDNVTYSHSCIGPCPVGLNFTGQSFSWTPDYDEAGIYLVTFTATDDAVTPLSSSATITITVNNTNRAPNLAAVSDQTVNEGDSITQIDLNDLGDDFDVDGDPITYSCVYDMGVGSTVVGGVSCGSLAGFSINASTGVIDWTTTQDGIYEFKVTGSDGDLSFDRVFLITVTNVNQAPVLAAIGNKTLNENTLLTITLSATDPEGDTIAYSYTCAAACPAGMSISSNVFTWTPGYIQNGTYTVTFQALDNGTPTPASDSEAITITVNDVNSAPNLAAISNQTVDALIKIIKIDANDGGVDFDVDGEAITYTCFYDTVVNGSVSNTVACSSLSGLTFNSSTGIMMWEPAVGASGNVYEFKITGTDGVLSDDSIFTITVTPAYSSLPLILTYRTTAGSQIIRLPTRISGYSYNYKVDWGDGSALAGPFTNGNSMTYTYTAAGDYQVKIYGKFSAIDSNSLTTEQKNRLIAVNDLGRTGIVNLVDAFKECINLTSFTTGNGDTSNVTDMVRMFSDADGITTLDLSGFNTSEVTNLEQAFYSMSNLVSIDFTGWDTSKVTSMAWMFSWSSKIQNLNINHFNTSNVLYMDYMFHSLNLLTELDLSNWYTPKVENMTHMFKEMSALESLYVENFDTANVVDMSAMFNSLSSLIALDISNFDTAKVTNMAEMFYGVSNLTVLDVSNFSVTNVTSMEFMFRGLSKVEVLGVGSWNVSKVTKMGGMFQNTSQLATLNLSSWDVREVTQMWDMFNGSSRLQTIDISNWNTSKVTDMFGMFRNTSSLTHIHMRNLNLALVTVMGSIFEDAIALMYLDLTGTVIKSPPPTSGNFLDRTPAGKTIYCNTTSVSTLFTTCVP